MDCFGRTSLVTVKIHGRPPANIARVGRRVSVPVILVSDVLGYGARRSYADGVGVNQLNSATHSSTTNPLTATTLIYALGAGITAGAGTRLVLQLLLDVGWF